MDRGVGQLIGWLTWDGHSQRARLEVTRRHDSALEGANSTMAVSYDSGVKPDLQIRSQMLDPLSYYGRFDSNPSP